MYTVQTSTLPFKDKRLRSQMLTLTSTLACTSDQFRSSWSLGPNHNPRVQIGPSLLRKGPGRETPPLQAPSCKTYQSWSWPLLSARTSQPPSSKLLCPNSGTQRVSFSVWGFGWVHSFLEWVSPFSLLLFRFVLVYISSGFSPSMIFFLLFFLDFLGDDAGGCLVGASAIVPSVVDTVPVDASAAVTLVTASVVILSVGATGAASATANKWKPAHPKILNVRLEILYWTHILIHKIWREIIYKGWYAIKPKQLTNQLNVHVETSTL